MRLRDFLSAAEAMCNLAVITHIDVTFQTVQQRVFIRVQHIIVDDQGIELIAWLEAAHLSDEAASRLGGYPECILLTWMA